MAIYIGIWLKIGTATYIGNLSGENKIEVSKTPKKYCNKDPKLKEIMQIMHMWSERSTIPSCICKISQRNSSNRDLWWRTQLLEEKRMTFILKCHWRNRD